MLKYNIEVEVSQRRHHAEVRKSISVSVVLRGSQNISHISGKEYETRMTADKFLI
jgi:hypothetical protein